MNAVTNTPTTFAPNDKVRCVKGYGGAHVPGILDEGAVYTVAVVVEKGEIVSLIGTKPASGIIVIPHVGCSYPYVWDADRFVKFEGETKINKYGVCVPKKK